GLVAEADLARGQRRPALRPPPDDLVALVEEALPEQLRERPPHALDVLAVVGHVRAREIDPERHAIGQRLPLARVAEHGLDALLREGLDAVLLDGRLPVDPELLLDLDLDREPVRVPAALARDVEATHRLVAGEEILDDPREDVPVVRQPVRRRRPL